MAEVQSNSTSSNGPLITVYWLNESRADRILLLLEELELPYVIEKFERGPDKLAPPALKKIHPLGKSPVIKDGDRVVAESGFIIDYLVEKYGRDKRLKPTKPDDLFHYNYFLHYIEGSLMPVLVIKYIFSNLQKQAPWIVKPIVNGICSKMNEVFIAPNLAVHSNFLEGELQKRKWLAGDEFSGADIQASFAVEMLMERAGISENQFPNLGRYVKALRERPAYKKAMEKIGKTSISA